MRIQINTTGDKREIRMIKELRPEEKRAVKTTSRMTHTCGAICEYNRVGGPDIGRSDISRGQTQLAQVLLREGYEMLCYVTDFSRGIRREMDAAMNGTALDPSSLGKKHNQVERDLGNGGGNRRI